MVTLAELRRNNVLSDDWLQDRFDELDRNQPQLSVAGFHSLGPWDWIQESDIKISGWVRPERIIGGGGDRGGWGHFGYRQRVLGEILDAVREADTELKLREFIRDFGTIDLMAFNSSLGPLFMVGSDGNHRACMAKALAFPRVRATCTFVDVAPVLRLKSRDNPDFTHPQLWIWKSLIDREFLKGELELGSSNWSTGEDLAILRISKTSSARWLALPPASASAIATAYRRAHVEQELAPIDLSVLSSVLGWLEFLQLPREFGEIIRAHDPTPYHEGRRLLTSDEASALLPSEVVTQQVDRKWRRLIRYCFG